MKTEFDDYKYIITTGCSYSQISKAITDTHNGSAFNSIRNIKKNKWIGHSNIIIIDVGLSSHGADWQSDSIIYTVDKLLSLGIKPESIYCFIEWSEWNRVSYNTNYLIKEDFSNLSFLPYTGMFGNIGIMDLDVEAQELLYSSFKDTYELNGIWHRQKDRYSEIAWKIEDELHIRQHKYLSQLAKIADRVYISPSHIENVLKGQDDEFDLWFSQALEYENKIPEDEKLKRYLDNILKTQWFLESKNINYNCLHMNSQFSNWIHDEASIKRQCGNSFQDFINPNDFSIIKDKLLPKSIDSDIEQYWPYHKDLFQKIDLSKWWFYENDMFRRGGIDEYALGEWGTSIYTHSNSLSDPDETKLKFEINTQIPNFGHHPVLIMYLFLWNLVAKDCSFLSIDTEYENWMKNLMIEDINSDELTKNAILISKKHITNIHKNRKTLEKNDIIILNQK